jgi:phenylpropionate dioxygenase-like ring-hydroxylating dioxygenase large terminal subunit
MSIAMRDPADLSALVDDRPGDGVFRVHRDAFRDADVFAREMATFFERGWVFVGHASQMPAPHDFMTLAVRGQPLVVMRGGDGTLRAFHNACRHKGALVCHEARGCRRVHVCQYHGWSYASDGSNVAVKAKAEGAYAPAFDADGHDLAAVACFGEYRGFLFASLAADVEPLEEHLGDARALLDLAVDQSPGGLELVPGVVRYTYRGNWKLQLENSLDAYHFTSTHPSYLRLLERRSTQSERSDVPKAIWQSERNDEERMGSFGLRNGHAMVWTTSPVEHHPLYAGREALVARVGAVRADWMMRTRQLNVFPNLQIASNAALQMRVVTPLAVDRTEITSYCLAPVGEGDAARARRLRQYEDFFNPSGLATPDDTTTFEDCQRGFRSGAIAWQQGSARGQTLVQRGADAHAAELGIAPETSTSGTFTMADETVFQSLYRHWAHRLAETAR